MGKGHSDTLFQIKYYHSKLLKCQTMCLLSLCSLSCKNVPFLCFHSRDEVVSRPVLGPDMSEGVFCFKDKLSNGTWLGYNMKSHVFVALTNVRNVLRNREPDAVLASRGRIVMDALQDDGYLSHKTLFQNYSNLGYDEIDVDVLRCPRKFRPFNLVITRLCQCIGEEHDPSTCTVTLYLSNVAFSDMEVQKVQQFGTFEQSLTTVEEIVRSDALDATKVEDALYCGEYCIVRKLPDGVHALSNSFVNDKRWVKVSAAQRSFSQVCKLANSLPANISTGFIESPSYLDEAFGQIDDDMKTELHHVLSGNPNGWKSLLCLLAMVTITMVNADPLPLKNILEKWDNFDWSPIPEAFEKILQSYRFIPYQEKTDYGTRALTFVVQIGRHFYFAFSSTDHLMSNTTEAKSIVEKFHPIGWKQEIRNVIDEIMTQADKDQSRNSFSEVKFGPLFWKVYKFDI